jgi:hypothetical protein
LLAKTKSKISKHKALPEPGWRRVWVGAESLPGKKKTENAKKEKRWAKAEMEERGV